MLTKWMSVAVLVLAARVAMGGCAPEFTTQPQGGTLPIGSFVKLFGQVNSATPVTWSWERDGTPLVDEGRFFGAATQELTINRIEVGDAGTYTLVATNACGTATSVEVELAVDCRVHWELKHPTAVRDVVFDHQRSRLIFAGSTGLFTAQNETWTWDGTAFRALSAFGPAADGLVTCFDSFRVVVVGVVRPLDGIKPLITWELHCDNWRSVAGAELPHRRGFAIAFDEVRGKTVLFGGSADGVRLNETWTWDGISWNLAASAGPTPRSDHAMAYDRNREVVVLYGGNTATGYSDETWEWNGVSWTLVSTGAPGQRVGHAMAFDASRGTTIAVGGYSSAGYVLETWEWDGKAWSKLPCNLPYPMQGLSMSYDENRQVLVATGPDVPTPTVNARIWECDGQQWVERFGLPEGRYGGAVAYDPIRKEVVRFGGPAPVSIPDVGDDTWTWNGMEWRLAATEGPAPRSNAVMAFDPRFSNLVMFGGTGVGGGETWLWDGSSWTEAKIAGPGARREASMAFDPLSNSMLLFGGSSSTVIDLNDTWSWDGQEWSKLDDNGPYIYSHGLAFDVTRQRMILHGRDPASQGGTISKTYEWNGKGWSEIVSVGPNINGQLMSVDVDRGSAVAYGTNADTQGIWEFLSDAWLRRAQVPGPSLRGDATYDAFRRVSVLGAHGFSGAATVRTWELRLAVEGDANADNLIDGRDLSVLLTQFGQSVPVGSGSDMNNDGIVDGADLGVLLSRSGEMCPP